ncbi:MAG: ABC transporter permease [Rhodocyclaceae bacterium]|nr:ABC transporter permease [Rhodocyclaceae bacterium]
MSANVRTPTSITFSVWNAIFLREALDRLFDMRFAWLWILLEPVLWIAFHSFGYRALHVNTVGGMDLTVWINAGFLPFILWRRTSTQVLHAVDSNIAFFVYRQVKPFDAAFMRAVLEAFLIAPIALIILSMAAAAGYGNTPGITAIDYLPRDPLRAIFGTIGTWLFALGYGLVTSVTMVLVREMEHIYKIMYLPLYVLSGVIVPVEAVPPPWRELFLLNPLVHGIEIVRQGFLPVYHTASGISMTYLYGCALGSVFLGLALYRRFSRELVTR